jgi:CheY-like chemotaxis protein
MQMPVMDGYEAARLIKSTEKGKHTPIIALTASLFEEDRKNMLRLGLDDCILKPFSENELLGTIGKMLDIKYIYEESKIHDVMEPYLHNDGTITEDLEKLPKELVLQMKDATESANFDLLIKLIDTIDPENPGLARRLAVLANNYDYDYLQKIFTRKDAKK